MPKEPEGKPNPIHFRFETFADEERFLQDVKRSATSPTIILRNLALAWMEHVEENGPIEFPILIESLRFTEKPPPYRTSRRKSS
jgi:hypothetical protein